jgi:tmRNA-binding protein
LLGIEYTASSTEFAGNVNLGYEVKTSEKGAVDISAGFVYINELSYFGMRLAYIFKL